MSIRTVAIGGSLAAIVSFMVMATNKHSGHEGTAAHTTTDTSGAFPSEGGQSMFAALIEIVGILERDENTDWEKINIDKLRLHLLDMDRLMRETNAKAIVLENNTIQFDVTGEAESIESIHNMAPTHAQYIQQTRKWDIKTELHSTGATLTIATDKPADLAFLSALGFYGFMSLDSHHQAHHFQMARGQSH